VFDCSVYKNIISFKVKKNLDSPLAGLT
jgi:hypothetical protein